MLTLNLDIKFLTNCLNVGIFPKFLNFRYQGFSNDDLNEIKSLALKKEIASKFRLLKKLQLKVKQFDLINKLSFVQYGALMYLLNKQLSAVKQQKSHVLCKKFHALHASQCFPTHPNCNRNFSNYKLNFSEYDVLRFGPNHPIIPSHVNDIVIKSAIEKVFLSLNIF